MLRFAMPMLLLMTVALAAVSPARAQDSGGAITNMKTLIQSGFDIKAAAPNGDKFVVFLQREREAYACEFVTLTVSRCGAINNEAN